MYCSSCGTKLPDEAMFCSNCGRKIESPPQTRTQEKNFIHSEGTCPICTRKDQVQKISAIVEHGTQRISGTSETWVSQEQGGYWATTPISGTQVTNLAIALAPPVRPSHTRTTWFWLGIIGGVFFVGCGCSFLLTPNLLGFWNAMNATEKIVMLTIIIGLIIIGASIVGSITSNNRMKRRKVEEMLPKWNKAYDRWNQLYYCFRDDVIFNPNDGKSMPISQMAQYLNY